MKIHGLIFLAAGGGADLVIYAIVFGFFFIGWIIKQVRNAISPSGGQTDAAAKERLAQLARQRREELMRMAQGRGGSDSSQASTPGNLSVPEYTARQQAKTLYERRAEALRRQQELAQAAPPRPAPQPMQLRPPQARPLPPVRQTPVARQPTRIPPPRPAAQRPPAAPQRRPASPAMVVRQGAKSALPRDAGQTIARQTRKIDDQALKDVGSDDVLMIDPDDAPAPVRAADAQASQRSAALRKVLSVQSVRAAFVLKELLDSPVGLRRVDQMGSGL